MAQTSIYPSGALAPFVAAIHYEHNDLPLRRERVAPSVRPSLMLNLHEDEFRTYGGADHTSIKQRTGGAALVGPRARASVIDTALQRRLVSVEFHPAAAAHFLPMPLGDLCDAITHLGDLWGREGATLRERLLEASSPQAMLACVEAVLVRRVRAAAGPDQLVVAAQVALANGMSVGALAERLGVSTSTLRRRFRAAMGLTPKAFARVQRLKRVLPQVAGRDTFEPHQGPRALVVSRQRRRSMVVAPPPGPGRRLGRRFKAI